MAQKFKEGVIRLFEIGEAIGNALTDGFQPLQDGFIFLSQAGEIEKLVKDFDEIWADRRNLTAESLTEIYEELAEEFDLDNDEIEEAIEGTFALVLKGYHQIQQNIIYVKEVATFFGKDGEKFLFLKK